MPRTSLPSACERRLLINATHGHVVRLLPALTITDDQIDEGCAILADVLAAGSRLKRNPGMPRHFLDLLEISPAEARRLIDQSIEIKRDEQAGRRPPLLLGSEPGAALREALAPHPCQLRGGDRAAGRKRHLSERQRRGAGGSRKRRRFRPGIEPVCRRRCRPHFLAFHGRRAGAIGHDSGHQRPLRRLAPMPGHGRFHDDRRAVRALIGKKLVFVGDGNNVARSLATASALLDVHFVLAAPPGYEFPPDFQAKFAARFPSVPLVVERDPHKAVQGADVVYTDVWTSMGQEHEAEVRACGLHPLSGQSRFDGAGRGRCDFPPLPARSSRRRGDL